jgi:hypothetical protein
VPIVGPAPGVGPALLVALAVKPEVLIPVVVACVVIQVVESNVLVPIVMRNAIGVSPLLMILSLLAGTALGGFVGALVAVPLVAAFEAVLERLQDRDVPVGEDSATARYATDEEMLGEPNANPGPVGPQGRVQGWWVIINVAVEECRHRRTARWAIG